jgi:hypothetical protein
MLRLEMVAPCPLEPDAAVSPRVWLGSLEALRSPGEMPARLGDDRHRHLDRQWSSFLQAPLCKKLEWDGCRRLRTKRFIEECHARKIEEERREKRAQLSLV